MLKDVRREGGNDIAFAGALFEMAIEMVRHGHIKWSEEGFECDTDKGKVTLNFKDSTSNSATKNNEAKAQPAAKPKLSSVPPHNPYRKKPN
jgi:deferrochelatase/peroxidase EfeB